MIKSIFKKVSQLLGIVILIVVPDLSEGQVQYDTTLIRKEPCIVKKVAMRYDTSLKEANANEVKKCNVDLKWPVFNNCKISTKSGALDSFLERSILSATINRGGKTLQEFCQEFGAHIFNRLNIKRLDENFLVVTYTYKHYIKNHASGPLDVGSIMINYDFNQEKVVELWDLFKEGFKEQAIIDEIKSSNQIEGQLILLKNKFMNLNRKLILYPHPTISSKEITIKKENLKKYLKEEYYK